MSRRTDPRILLIQAREPGDPILEHEFECFVDRTQVSPEAFTAVNLAESRVSSDLLAEIDLVTVGGAGDYSIVERNFDWYGDLIDLIDVVLARDIPMFASCFGFHALVKALGGQLVTDPECGEIGTHAIRLTEQGAADDFFGQLPETFDAQLGHKDSVVELPDDLVCLAASDRCAVQAVRVPGKPIYATQFHPELTADDNIERYVRYLQNYKQIDETRDEALERAERIHRTSPEAAQLLQRFMERTFGAGERSA